MICVQIVNEALQVMPVAAGETCQYINLIQQTDFTEQEAVFNAKNVFALVGAAASCYGLVFVIKIALAQFGIIR